MPQLLPGDVLQEVIESHPGKQIVVASLPAASATSGATIYTVPSGHTLVGRLVCDAVDFAEGITVAQSTAVTVPATPSDVANNDIYVIGALT